MAEAVALCRLYYCVGQEGLHTSLKPEEALIYLYDGRMVGLFSHAEVGSTIGGTKTCHSRYGTKLRHPDHTTISYSVQAFLTNAIEGISHS